MEEVEVWFVENSLEEGFRSFRRAGENELAFGPLGEEWIDHLVESKVPPWNIDEHLQEQKKQQNSDQKKIKNKRMWQLGRPLITGQKTKIRRTCRHVPDN